MPIHLNVTGFFICFAEFTEFVRLLFALMNGMRQNPLNKIKNKTDFMKIIKCEKANKAKCAKDFLLKKLKKRMQRELNRI